MHKYIYLLMIDIKWIMALSAFAKIAEEIQNWNGNPTNEIHMISMQSKWSGEGVIWLSHHFNWLSHQQQHACKSKCRWVNKCVDACQPSRFDEQQIWFRCHRQLLSTTKTRIFFVFAFVKTPIFFEEILSKSKLNYRCHVQSQVIDNLLMLPVFSTLSTAMDYFGSKHLRVYAMPIERNVEVGWFIWYTRISFQASRWHKCRFSYKTASAFLCLLLSLSISLCVFSLSL